MAFGAFCDMKMSIPGVQMVILHSHSIIMKLRSYNGNDINLLHVLTCAFS